MSQDRSAASGWLESASSRDVVDRREVDRTVAMAHVFEPAVGAWDDTCGTCGKAENDPIHVPNPDFPPGFVWDEEAGVPSYQLYTAQEVAKALGVVERTVRRWIESGKLPAEKQGGVFRIRLEDARRVYNQSRGASTVERSQLATYVQWLEAENARLWGLLEKAVSRG